jgi:hypothetical protein
MQLEYVVCISADANNTDHMINHTVEMQEMQKLIQYQQEQHKLTIGYLGVNK